jgi:hypothetical protein
MASRGQSITVVFYAYDTANSIGKTGDAANFTLKWVKDGTAATPTNIPATEIDGIILKGLYSLVMTTAECTANFGALGGVSSTSGIVIVPVFVTFEQLPTPAPGASNGLWILGTNAGSPTVSNLTLTTVSGSTNLAALTLHNTGGGPALILTSDAAEGIRITSTTLPAVVANGVPLPVGLVDGAITETAFTFPGEATGRPTTFLAWVRRIGERLFNKRVRDRSVSPAIVSVRNAADTATLETFTEVTSGSTDTITKGV